jgi:hypothetical protein
MDYREFSQKVKAKHPGAYDDLDDETLARKMVAKFPEYSDVTFGGSAGRSETSKRSLPEKASGVVASQDDFELANTPSGAVKQVADATMEAFVPTKDSIKRFFDPNAGRFSVSRILEALGKKTGKAVRSAAQNTAEQASESKFGQDNPNTVGAAGAIYSTIADILSDSLTPSAAQQQIGGEGASAVIGKGAAAIGRKVGKGLAKAGQMTTGIKSQEFERLAKDPRALFAAKSKEAAGELMDEALEKEGLKTTPTASELFDPQLSKARDIAADVYERIQKGEAVSAQEILKARQATDRIIAGTSYKDKPAIQRLVEARQQLNTLLEKVSPETARASGEYARASLAGKFRRVLPVTATGEPSVARSVVQPMIAAASGLGTGNVPAAVAMLAASSPVVAGLITSLGSMSTQSAAKILGSPAIRRLLVAEYQKAQREASNAQ